MGKVPVFTLNQYQMKKFLLTLGSLVLASAFAMAQETKTVTIDMTNVVTENGWANTTPLSSFTDNDVTFKFDTAKGSNNPKVYVSSTGVGGFYLYNGNTMEISVPAGNRIESMTFTATGISYYLHATCDLGKITTTGMKVDYEWTTGDDVSSVITFTGNGTSQIKTVVITYSEFSGKIPEKANLSFPETEYVVTMGEDFEAPELTKSTNAAAVYTSSNPEVATVDSETGAVTLVKPGKTTITATCEANEDYFAGTASYLLDVKKVQVIEPGEHNIDLSIADMTGFTTVSTTYQYGQNIDIKDDGIDVYCKRGGYTNIYYYYAGQDLQVPANSTVEIVAPEGYFLKSVTFNLSPDGVKFQPALTPSVGEVEPQTVGGNKIEWTGKEENVTFTIGAKAEFSETSATSAGKLCFTSIDVNYGLDDIESGVEAIEANEGVATYYDLNGRQVKGQLQNGLYIKVLNGKASKVIVK